MYTHLHIYIHTYIHTYTHTMTTFPPPLPHLCLYSPSSDDEVCVPGSALLAHRVVIRAGLQTLCISSKHCNKAVDDCNNTAADDRARLMQLLMPELMSLAALRLTDDDMVCCKVSFDIYIYTYIYIYVYVCVYIYIYIYTYTHIYIHVQNVGVCCFRMRSSLCNATCMHTYIHTYTHTCIHAYMHTYIHTYIHTHIYTYKHTHIYTYIHT